MRALDVIKIHDDQIRPPGPKFVVCVEPSIGLYLRINSDGWRDGSLAIARVDHLFLSYDCFIECGQAFELDDYVVKVGIANGGVRGTINSKHAAEICAMVLRVASIPRRDKIAICKALGCSAWL